MPTTNKSPKSAPNTTKSAKPASCELVGTPKDAALDVIRLALASNHSYLSINAFLQGDIASVTINTTERPTPGKTEEKPANASRPTAPTIRSIGEYWEGQGGYNAGLMRGKDGDDYFLIVAPLRFEFDSCFGESGKEIATDWLDGYANTQLMLTSGNYPAAKKCAELTHENHSDFYLWSRREARLAAANIPELFDKNLWYLTSSQSSAGTAYVQDFDDGYQDTSDKDDEFRVRPVRRLFIRSLINF